MNNIVTFIYKSHIAVTTFVLFLGKMTRNMTIQVLLGIECGTAGDTFEILENENKNGSL
jgi:hypothetical protein